MKNKKNKRWLIIAITFLILVLVLWCFRPRVQSSLETKQEQKRLDGILEQINNLYIENDDLQSQRENLENAQTQLHNSAELNREEISRLRNEYYKDTDDERVNGFDMQRSRN